MTETRSDGFLDGRLVIDQPVHGYRSGADAVMLAAACPAQAGQDVLELGCGAGVASLCLGWRVPDARLTGLEMQAEYAALARQNAARNGLRLDVVLGDIAAMPDALRQISFDHVIANPPYFLAGTTGPDRGRSTSRHEATPISVWIDTALRRLRPGGHLTMIQRADRLDQMITAIGARAGAIRILPIAARSGREAGRVILSARKGARSPMRLLAPLIVHEKSAHDADGEDFTDYVRLILRNGAPINLG